MWYQIYLTKPYLPYPLQIFFLPILSIFWHAEYSISQNFQFSAEVPNWRFSWHEHFCGSAHSSNELRESSSNSVHSHCIRWVCAFMHSSFSNSSGICFSATICGFYTSVLSIAPMYSGTLTSLSMVAGTFGNIIGPLLLSLLVNFV